MLIIWRVFYQMLQQKLVACLHQWGFLQRWQFSKSLLTGWGTYTGLEAVSNNVNMLAEPRVRTGKFTMLYMALSLSFTAGGIIVLYLLWHAEPVFGQTLNAVVFDKILAEAGFSHHWLAIILFFETALLFVGANTGF